MAKIEKYLLDIIYSSDSAGILSKTASFDNKLEVL